MKTVLCSPRAQGHESATVDYRVKENIVFDFSDGSRQMIERDVTILGFDRVWIFSGSGDDEFIGRRGNDDCDAGVGEDTASFDGSRDDYRARALDSGYVQVTGLRDSSPDGTDLYNSVDHFVFAGREVDLA